MFINNQVQTSLLSGCDLGRAAAANAIGSGGDQRSGIDHNSKQEQQTLFSANKSILGKYSNRPSQKNTQLKQWLMKKE